MFKSNELPRKGKKTGQAAEKAARDRVGEDRKKVADFARQIKKNQDGSYTTQTYNRYKRLGKKWPKVEKSEALVKKWAPLLTDIDDKHRMEAARAFEMEAHALRDISEADRAGSIGPMLKFVFPALARYFKNLS